MFKATILLALATCALALEITAPTNSSGWTTSGPNTVSWSSVSTDASSFAIALVNENEYPVYTEILATNVSTSVGSITVNPPSGGWTSGSGFQVNLVKDSDDLDEIYTQSGDITIAESSSSTYSSATSSSSSSGSASATHTSGSVSSSTSSAVTSSASSVSSASTHSASSASASASSSATTSSSAASGLEVQTGVLGLLAILGIALA